MFNFLSHEPFSIMSEVGNHS